MTTKAKKRDTQGPPVSAMLWLICDEIDELRCRLIDQIEILENLETGRAPAAAALVGERLR